MGCLYPDRIFLGVGTGEALNEIATGYEGEWPEFKERYARLRESVELMRELWLGDRVDFDGEYYRTKDASIYDVPEGGSPSTSPPAGRWSRGTRVARPTVSSAPREGQELYPDELIPARKGRRAGRTASTTSTA